MSSGLGGSDFGAGFFGSGEDITPVVSASSLSRRGFGTARFGVGRFGTGDVVSPFNLIAATAPNTLTLVLDFDQDLMADVSIIQTVSNYTITGGNITITAAERASGRQIKLTISGLTPFLYERVYTITLNSNIKSSTLTALTVNVANFILHKTTKARRVNKHQYFNPGFGIVSETYDDI